MTLGCLERLGDRRDEARVVGDVLPHPTVTASRERDHAPLLVDDVHREAVDLELAQQLRHRTEILLDPTHPRRELLAAERVVETEQPLQVLHGGEHRRSLTTHRLRRRVSADQLGMLGLERLQLAEQRVVLRIGQGRVVLAVIAGACLLDRLDQLTPPRCGIGCGARLVTRGHVSARPPAGHDRSHAPREVPRPRGRASTLPGRTWVRRAPGGRTTRASGRGDVQERARGRR